MNITVTNQTKPTIAIFGMGYVGCVSAACFAETGFHVIGVDIDERKLASIAAGRAPFHEPGLEPLIVRNIEAGRLTVNSSFVTTRFSRTAKPLGSSALSGVVFQLSFTIDK